MRMTDEVDVSISIQLKDSGERVYLCGRSLDGLL